MSETARSSSGPRTRADRIGALPPERARLFAQLQQQRRRQAQDAKSLAPRRDGASPTGVLSFAQRRLWFVQQLEPDAALYTEQGSFHLSGPLDVERFARCMDLLAERHAALRSLVRVVEGRPVLELLADAPRMLRVEDLRDRQPEDRQQALREAAADDLRRPFDLSTGPLLRVRLARVAADEHVLITTIHQLAGDGWSLNVLTREAADLYDGLASGTEASLARLPMSYADYAAWQEQLVSGPAGATQLAYWKQRLEGSSARVDLSAAGAPRPRARTYEGGLLASDLSASASQALRQLSRRLGVTLFSTMLGAWALLLSRRTGLRDLVVSVPVAGRHHVDLEPLVGFFVNVLPLRLDLAGQPTFADLARRVHRTALEAYLRQDVPFEQIVRAAAPGRQTGEPPFLDVLFNFESFPEAQVAFADVAVRRLELAPPIAKCPITCYVDDRPGSLRVRIVYQVERFAAEDAASLLDQYEALLHRIVDHPALAIEAYSLITDRSRSLLPDLAAPLPPRAVPLVLEAIRERVARQPDDVALQTEVRAWTFAELWDRASQAARACVAAGLQPRDVVALSGRSSGGLIVGALGVWLAGGVLLLLDHALPDVRRRAMLAQARPRLRMTVARDDESLPVDGDGSVPVSDGPASATRVDCVLRVDPDDGRVTWASASEAGAFGDETLPEIAPDDPAYIFFTSGTTGTPKGIIGSHKGLGHFLQWQHDTFGVTRGDRSAQFTGLSFDVVLRDLFLPLVSGATLCLPGALDERGETPLAWMARQRISILHTTPSLASAWLRQADDALALPLRVTFFAGEPLADTLVRRWRRRAPGTAVVNLYGPTETTLAKCCFVVPDDASMPAGVQPVGAPLPETQALVLAPDGRPCGIGERGEIAIRTPFRTLGFLDQTNEDRARFQVNPRRPDDETDLIYRTGDAGRHRPDGLLEILGRLDDQVKIRGVRVEPSEVAAALAQHEAIEVCTVVARTDAPRLGVSSSSQTVSSEASFSQAADARGPAGHTGTGEDPSAETMLEAYFIARAAAPPPSAADLRQFLGRLLLPSMIPARFVAVSAFPLTPSGKIDRRALAALADAEARAEAATPHDEAATEREREMLAVWREVLAREAIGVTDNFFELGGHSLLAAELTHRLGRLTGRDVPLRLLFDAPTVRGLAQAIDAQPLAGPSGATGARAEELPRIEPDLAARYEPFPLTDVQQAYWVGRGSQFELGNVATHNYTEFELSDDDVPRLNAAFVRVIERHEMLRAIVRADGLQQILPEVPPFVIPIHDLRGLDAAAAQAGLERTRQRMSHQVLPLDHWPLFEAAVSQRDGGRAILHLSVDALICDAWSRRLLGRELLRACRHPEEERAAPGVSFRDYVLAEQRLKPRARYREAERYWLDRLDTLPPAPELPLIVAPSSIKHPQFVRRRFVLPADEWSAVKAHGARFGLTPSAVVATAYADVLGSWSKSSSFTINLTIFNRLPVHPEITEVVGDFTSLILLAIHNARDARFEARARRLQAQLWRDLDHGLFSGVRVMRELNRRLGGAPRGALMPVVLTSTLFQQGAAADDAWQRDARFGITQTPQVFIDHVVSANAGALQTTWDVVDELFPPGMVDEMFAAYERLLRRLASGEAAWTSARRSSLLPASQDARRRAINDTSGPRPHGLLQDDFWVQVAARPSDTAVIAGETRLTYAELAACVTRVAEALRAAGARPETLVGIVMEKGWEQAAAVLAVVESGAAYLPIEASWPPARQAALLARGDVRLVLTQPAVAARTTWPADIRPLVVTADDAAAGVAAASSAALASSVAPAPALAAAAVPTPVRHAQPGDLAYVIFTSGSTGAPKGVRVDHAAALNTVVDLNTRYAVGPADRVLALSALGFDLSVYDLFGLLGAGGTVVFPPPGSERQPDAWYAQLINAGVTLWNSVPALCEMLLEHVESRQLPPPASLRLVLLSGDWIPVALPDRLRRWAPGVEVIGLGGATEAAIWSIAYPIAGVPESWTSIPYGQPLRNQWWRVLTASGLHAPEGVPGELYIGGVGLAQGYWRDPAQTATRFVPDPEGDGRLYRTGDWGRYRPDGTLEFLGRQDLQVKVHGHRIELGEIEAVLHQHPDVARAVVTTAGPARGARHLIAYIVPRGDRAEQAYALERGGRPEAIIAFLQQRLPAYMVPARWVTLEVLPLSANGKVDLKALAAIEERPSARPPADDHLTPIEELLLNIAAEVLGHGDVAKQDNLFQLGADSISALQFASRLRAALDVELPLQQVFEAETLAELAALVDAIRTDASASTPISASASERGASEAVAAPAVTASAAAAPAAAAPADRTVAAVPGSTDARVSDNANAAPAAPSLVRVPRHGDLPLSFAQERLWFLCQRSPTSSSYNLPMAIRMSGPLDRAALEQALATVVRRHEVLRSAFGSKRGKSAITIAADPRVTLDRLDAAGADDADVQTVLLEQAKRPFDLAVPGLFRAQLIRRADDEHVLALTLHHLTADAWSLEILANELVAHYECALSPRAPRLPDLPVQYIDFAHWQRQWLCGDRLQRQLAYWVNQLAGVSASHGCAATAGAAVGHTAPDTPAERAHIDRIPFSLDAPLSAALVALARKENATLFMVMLAAFDVVLHTHLQQDDLLVNSSVATRGRPETQGLIGLFLNTVLLRTDLSGDPTFGELVARVRRTTLEAHAHQDAPFQQVVAALRQAGVSGGAPASSIAFGLRREALPARDVAGLTLTRLDVHRGAAKFDLELQIAAGAGGIRGTVDFDADIFTSSTMRAMLARYRVLLQLAATDSSLSVRALTDRLASTSGTQTQTAGM